jgi:hypothetical protein
MARQQSRVTHWYKRKPVEKLDIFSSKHA